MSKPSTRRTLQQAKHCIEEALSVVEHSDEHSEDSEFAVADLEQAQELIREALKALR